MCDWRNVDLYDDIMPMSERPRGKQHGVRNRNGARAEEEFGGLGELKQHEGEWEQQELAHEFEGEQFFGTASACKPTAECAGVQALPRPGSPIPPQQRRRPFRWAVPSLLGLWNKDTVDGHGRRAA
jgi:hypothetical protein